MMIWLLVGAAQAQDGNTSVLIKGEAQIFTQPDGDDAKFSMGKNIDNDEQPDKVYFAELIEKVDGWTHVRTSVYRAPCHKALGTNMPFGLELWVKNDDLANVVTRPIELNGRNGTSVRIHPGAVAYENVDASHTVAAKGLTVKAILPEGSVGTRFTPVRSPYSNFNPTHGATGVFGDDKIVITAENAPATGSSGAWTMERSCITATGPAVDASAPVPGAGTPDSRGGTARRIPNLIPVPEGTVLWWPDGVYAGTTTIKFGLENDGIDDTEGLICGPIRKGVLVCIDDPAVEGTPPLRYAAPGLEKLEAPDPKHPKGAVKGESDKCRLQIDVNKKGEVTAVEARACATEFEQAAEETVKGWTFKPHQVDGKPALARTWTWVKFED